jgi:fatty-acyl-CoA synthase
MQDYELTLHHGLWQIEHLFARKAVVTKTESGIHRTTYAQMVPRINQLAAALNHLGVATSDRVTTLCWNNYRHLEL